MRMGDTTVPEEATPPGTPVVAPRGVTPIAAPRGTPEVDGSICSSVCDLAGVHIPSETSETHLQLQTPSQSQLELVELGYYSNFNSGTTTPCGGELGHVPLGLRPNASACSLPLGTRALPCATHTGTSTPLLGAGPPVMRTSVSMLNGKSCSMILSGPGCSYLTADGKQNLSETNSAIIPICRICHMPEDESDSMLISPCRCAGTMQFIHNSCLMKWLEIKTKKSKKPPKCELCRYQYHRHKKFKFHHWRFPRVSQQDKILHIIFIINLIIMIACAIATVLCFLSDKGKITKFPRNKVDLTTEEIITLSCGVLFFVSFFIAMSVQIKAKHTIYQLFVKFIMQNMEWEIDEYDKSKDSLYKPSLL